MLKNIKLELSNSNLTEEREASVMYDGTAYLTDNPNNCKVGYRLTYDPDTAEAEGTLSVVSATKTEVYRVPNWRDAPVAWAFAVQAMQTANVTPSRIRAYFEAMENGGALAPLELTATE